MRWWWAVAWHGCNHMAAAAVAWQAGGFVDCCQSGRDGAIGGDAERDAISEDAFPPEWGLAIEDFVTLVDHRENGTHDQSDC